MTRIAQVFLMTGDFDDARTFYEQVLGLEPQNVGDSSVAYQTGSCELKVETDFDRDVLEQFGMSSPPQGSRGAGSVHVLKVDEELDGLYDHMQAALKDEPGELLIEPREVPWGGRMFLVRDPDGYVFEIRQRIE